MSEQAKPNVITLADVEDVYKVTYIPGQAFIVHLTCCELKFKREGKLYVANYQDVLTPKVYQVCTTVKDNETIYTRTEICSAKEVYEFLKCSGYPSPDEAIHLFQEGNIFGCPTSLVRI